MSTVRIKEVAKLARVSTATVSHVINKTRFVSDDTKRKVLYAIERVGYTPNIHARNLASGRSRMLGLIISDITNPFFPDLVKSIQEKALELGYDVIVLNTNYDPSATPGTFSVCSIESAGCHDSDNGDESLRDRTFLFARNPCGFSGERKGWPAYQQHTDRLRKGRS